MKATTTRSRGTRIWLPAASALLACVVFATLDRLTPGPHPIVEPPRPRVVPKPFVAPPAPPPAPPLAKAAPDLPPPPVVPAPFASPASLPPIQLPPLPAPAPPLWTIEAGRVRRSTDGGASWHIVSIAPGAVFHAVAQIGPRTWAGGDHGAIYYSNDLGAHWTRTSIPGLAEAVTSIGSSPAADLRIGTASEGFWKSRDSGLHWRRE